MLLIAQRENSSWLTSYTLVGVLDGLKRVRKKTLSKPLVSDEYNLRVLNPSSVETRELNFRVT